MRIHCSPVGNDSPQVRNRRGNRLEFVWLHHAHGGLFRIVVVPGTIWRRKLDSCFSFGITRESLTTKDQLKEVAIFSPIGRSLSELSIPHPWGMIPHRRAIDDNCAQFTREEIAFARNSHVRKLRLLASRLRALRALALACAGACVCTRLRWLGSRFLALRPGDLRLEIGHWKSARNPSRYGGVTTPFSVMIPVTYLAGVTSKAGLMTPIPSGATCRPKMCVTSWGFRSSIVISAPLSTVRSIVERGTAA